MKRLTITMTIAVVALLTAQGCIGRAIGEVYESIAGGKGIYVPITPVSSFKEDKPLGIYNSFELGTFTDDFGKCPEALFTELPAQFDVQLAKAKLPNQPGGNTLLIRGKVLHYEDAKVFGLDTVFGPYEEVVARVELVDKASGKVLGVANCVGRTSKSSSQGVSEKAQGLAKGIVSWIDARYPKEGHVKEE